MLRARGFTLVEVGIALVVLAVALGGLVASAGLLARQANEAEIRADAQQVLQERAARIRTDGRYARLAALYAGVDSGVPGLGGATLTTTVTPVRTADPSGRPIAYTVVRLVLDAPSLAAPLSRRLTVAAP